MIHETRMENEDEETGYLPAVDINRLNVGMLLNRLDESGSEAFKIDKNRYYASWDTLKKARMEYYDSTSKVLLKDL